MSIVLLLLIVAVFVFLALRFMQPKTERLSQALLPPDDLTLALPLAPDEAFHRCQAALEATGAEIRCADPDRGLFTAAYLLGGHRDRLALIVRIYPDGDGSEVQLDYKASSYSAAHDSRATERLLALRNHIRQSGAGAQ